MSCVPIASARATRALPGGQWSGVGGRDAPPGRRNPGFSSSPRRTSLWLAAALWLVVVGLLTLTPTAPSPRADGNLVPLAGTLSTAFADPGRALSQLGGNLLLLAPAAVALAAVRPVLSLPAVAAALAATSGLIEVVQQLLVPGRVGDVDDVLLNVVGGLVAVVVARRVGSPRRD